MTVTGEPGIHQDGFAADSIEGARRRMTARLRAVGIESPELDARLLTCAALGLDLTALIRDAARTVTAEQANALEAALRRRLAGEPVARITGSKEFWGLSLALSANTLVPRPDTETVVEAALGLLRRPGMPTRPLRILDLGTGSGAILLALLSELPGASGVGTDISIDALHTARANAAYLGLGGRTAWVACSYGTAIGGAWDLVVSNPPYVRSADIPKLSVEVRDHDPVRALDGGGDGFDAYRELIPQAAGLLDAGGILVVEAGIGQSGGIGEIMLKSGLTIAGAPRPDLGGVERAVASRKMPR